MRSFLANLEKAWETRPCTLLHGDVNPGNIWRRKAGVDEEFVFGDWQLILRGPVAWDFITLLICTKVSRGHRQALVLLRHRLRLRLRLRLGPAPASALALVLQPLLPLLPRLLLTLRSAAARRASTRCRS